MKAWLFIIFSASTVVVGASASMHVITLADGTVTTNLRMYVEGGLLSTIPYVLSRETSPDTRLQVDNKKDVLKKDPFQYKNLTPEDFDKLERRTKLTSHPAMSMSKAEFDLRRKVGHKKETR